MDIPRDVIEYVILGYIPETFLSINRRLNKLARSAIERLLPAETEAYLDKIIRTNSAKLISTDSWVNRVFLELVRLHNCVANLVKIVYFYDSDNCIPALFNANYDISLYSFEPAFAHRSLKCLQRITALNNGKFAMYAYMYAMRFDDTEILAVTINNDLIKLTSGKLYCALIERRLNCYKYLLNKITPDIETYEYLVSQDLPQLLDETLDHATSWDFKNTQINSIGFHRFVGESANLPTLRVLIRHNFNPSLHNQVAITAASSNNMSVAIALSKYLDKMIVKNKK